MAYTDINSEDRLVQKTFADHLRQILGWKSVHAWNKEQTQAEVETFILDNLYMHLPSPPFTAEDKQEAAKLVYQHVWQQSASGIFGAV